MQQLRDVLLATTDDPTVRRLFPTAYHEDPDRDQEYQQLVRDELLERRLAALALVEATAADDDLDEAGLTGWLTALNDLRLVLGTRLDVSEDDHDVDPDDPDAPAHAVYHYLGMLLERGGRRAGGRPPPADRTRGVGSGSARLSLLRYPQRGTEPPSSSGLGHRPFTPAARVRIPLGVQR